MNMTLEKALIRIEQLKGDINRQNDVVMRHLAALQEIADMDPQSQRADDLGKAARIARSAVAGVTVADEAERMRAAGFNPADTLDRPNERCDCAKCNAFYARRVRGKSA
jgi:hypothetical protein